MSYYFNLQFNYFIQFQIKSFRLPNHFFISSFALFEAYYSILSNSFSILSTLSLSGLITSFRSSIKPFLSYKTTLLLLLLFFRLHVTYGCNRLVPDSQIVGQPVAMLARAREVVGELTQRLSAGVV